MSDPQVESLHYYDTASLGFINTIYALDIAIKQHYADMVFKGDQTRIIYASDAYALRKRSQTQTLNNLDLPFMNFRLTSIEPNTDRSWWNHMANIDGLFIKAYGRKIRFTPIMLQYEASLWFHSWRDAIFAQTEIFFDNSNETVLKPLLTLDGSDEELENIAVLGYNLNFNPKYNETDWLEQNKIQSLDLGLKFDTYLFKDNYDVSIPTKVIFDFLVDEGIETGTPEENYEALVDHLTEEVGDFISV